MKSLIFITIFLVIIIPFTYAQHYSISLNRPSKLTGSASKLTVTGPGSETVILKNNSSGNLTGTLPSDSIIELSFRRLPGRPTKYFLYPNGTFQYSLVTKVGMMGVAISDLSVYPGLNQPEKPSKNSAFLPKGFKVAKNLSISYVHEKTLKSDEVRKQWARQGGKMIGRSISYLVTYGNVVVKDVDFKTSTSILGGGWTYTQNYYNLKIPEYKPGIAKWSSLVYGATASVNLHMANVKISPPPLPDYESSVSGSFVFLLSGNIGYTLGLGKFRTEAEYKGVALDLTYKPSLTTTVGPGVSQTELNYMGFGFDISRTSFSAFANRIAPRAKSKFSFLFLPPLKENSPLLITFGYGLVWYR